MSCWWPGLAKNRVNAGHPNSYLLGLVLGQAGTVRKQLATDENDPTPSYQGTRTNTTNARQKPRFQLYPNIPPHLRCIAVASPRIITQPCSL